MEKHGQVSSPRSSTKRSYRSAWETQLLPAFTEHLLCVRPNATLHLHRYTVSATVVWPCTENEGQCRCGLSGKGERFSWSCSDALTGLLTPLGKFKSQKTLTITNLESICG